MKPSIKELLLRKLRYVGKTGLHSFSGANLFGIRCAARIFDLRKDGYHITSKDEKKGKAIGVRWTLIEKI